MDILYFIRRRIVFDALHAAKACLALICNFGVSIFGVWTDSCKQEMYDSRIVTTRNLVKALAGGRARVLCSTSAVGFYGNQGDETLTEEHPPGDDFLARLAVDWEKEAHAAESGGGLPHASALSSTAQTRR